MKAFQSRPSASRILLPFHSTWQTPYLPQLFLASCFQTFHYNFFQLTYCPLKMWPQKVVWLLQTQFHDTSCDLTVSFLSFVTLWWCFRNIVVLLPFQSSGISQLSWLCMNGSVSTREGQGTLHWCYSISFGWHTLLVLFSWDLKSDLQSCDQSFFLTTYMRCEERTCETGPWECDLEFPGGHS